MGVRLRRLADAEMVLHLFVSEGGSSGPTDFRHMPFYFQEIQKRGSCAGRDAAFLSFRFLRRP
jgi:hypothetical protein